MKKLSLQHLKNSKTKKTVYQMVQPLKISRIILSGILFTVIFSLDSIAGSSSKPKNNKWNASVSGGVAQLVSEFTNDFQFLESEFQHNPGWALNINIGRTIGNHWEPGISFGVYKLSGTAEQADFTANGIHASFKDIYPGIPVEYDNISSSLLFFMRYYVREFSNQKHNRIRFDPYAEIGGGMNIFATELFYQTTPPGKERPVIFQKAGNNKGNVGQMSVGLGTQVGFGSKWKLTVSLNTDWVNYDCLDGVHNYNNEGERNHAKDIVSRLMVGMVIPIGVASGGGISSENEHYPWSP
jgi:hypothetical protein